VGEEDEVILIGWDFEEECPYTCHEVPDDEDYLLQDDYDCHEADIDRDLGGSGTDGRLYEETGL
jgi:hypothetical protein